jgi:hypothetical protein
MATKSNARARHPPAPEKGVRRDKKEEKSFLLAIISNLFDIVIHCNPFIKSAVISAIVLLFSAIDFGLSGQLGVLGLNVLDFSERNNALNMYFVKISWFWTLVCVVPLSLATGYLLSGVSFKGTFVSVGRMILATAIWWVFTTFFIHVDRLVGTCSGETDITDRVACHRKGHGWVGFDISGHIFLLTYSILLITEELEALKAVCSFYQDGSSVAEITSDRERQVHAKETVKLVNSLSVYFKCFCFAFMVAAFMMLVATSLFFHTFGEKILGLLLGVFCWWITYRFLYRPNVLNWAPVLK